MSRRWKASSTVLERGYTLMLSFMSAVKKSL
jgi:hypothetical protein